MRTGFRIANAAEGRLANEIYATGGRRTATGHNNFRRNRRTCLYGSGPRERRGNFQLERAKGNGL